MITHKEANKLPTQPGVYMFYKGTTPLYIGKSINLKTRVKSHIAQAKLSKKEAAIVNKSTILKHMTTLNNFDALILEAKLIQKHKPKYNVHWKDDKHYLYIKVTVKDTYPKLYAVRQENDGKSIYFGPFRSTKMTQKLLFELRRVVPYCTNKNIGKRGCFYSKIGLCNPCPNVIHNEKDINQAKELMKKYKKNIQKVKQILSGNTYQFTRGLEKRIKILSDDERYEEAIEVRNKLFQFSLFLDRRSFTENSTSVNINLGQLQTEFNDFLKKHFKSGIKGSYRIECYDISNLFGKQPTGSMVVFKDGLFSKADYRKFSVRYKKISDVHMMKEVLHRRLKHDDWGRPDLIILDGGRPQLRTIYELFKETGVSIPLISLAKRPDRIITPRNNFKPIFVERNSLLFKLFQSLRDESHRFAKKYHVLLRNRNLLN